VKRRLAILLSGRGSNMEAVVESCDDGVLSGLAEVVMVVANKPSARGLEVAADLGVPTAVVRTKGRSRAAFEREVIGLLDPLGVDLVVLAGFMRLLSPVFVGHYRGRIVNIHPADTAAYKGLHGYEWAWESGRTETRITVHRVDEGMDTGPVIAQAVVDLRGAGTLEEVERRGLVVEHRFYAEVLAQLCAGPAA